MILFISLTQNQVLFWILPVFLAPLFLFLSTVPYLFNGHLLRDFWLDFKEAVNDALPYGGMKSVIFVVLCPFINWIVTISVFKVFVKSFYDWIVGRNDFKQE